VISEYYEQGFNDCRRMMQMNAGEAAFKAMEYAGRIRDHLSTRKRDSDEQLHYYQGYMAAYVRLVSPYAQDQEG